MEVKMDELTFEKALKSTKNFVLTDSTRPILQYIRLDVKTDELVFSATDGYKATRMHVSKKNLEEFTVFFSPFNFKASKGGMRQVTIRKEDDICIIEIEAIPLVEETYRFKQPSGSSIDLQKVYERQDLRKARIAFNAHYLSQALNAIKSVSNDPNKMAVIEFGENDLQPIVIKNSDEEFLIEELILPLRILTKGD